MSGKIQVFDYLFTFLYFHGVDHWNSKIAERQFLFFLLINNGSGRLARIRWSVFISKSQRILCVSFSRTDCGLYIYHLVVWSSFYLLHNSRSSVVRSPVFLLSQFVINCLIFFSTQSTLAILWCIINFHFDINWSLSYFVLLLKGIEFLSCGFPVLNHDKII